MGRECIDIQVLKSESKITSSYSVESASSWEISAPGVSESVTARGEKHANKNKRGKTRMAIIFSVFMAVDF